MITTVSFPFKGRALSHDFKNYCDKYGIGKSTFKLSNVYESLKIFNESECFLETKFWVHFSIFSPMNIANVEKEIVWADRTVNREN